MPDALPELCSSCHRSECEPQHSCFAAFVTALGEAKRDADAGHFAKYLQEYNNSAECKDAFDALFARKTTPHLP